MFIGIWKGGTYTPKKGVSKNELKILKATDKEKYKRSVITCNMATVLTYETTGWIVKKLTETYELKMKRIGIRMSSTLDFVTWKTDNAKPGDLIKI